MKRMAAVTTVLLAAVAQLVVTGCAPLGGPPLNVTVAAATDSTVQITWSTPAEGVADEYVVYFKAQGETSYTQVGDTTASSYVHDPVWKVGKYRVTARFGGDTYDSQDTTGNSTVPVHGETDVLYELNADPLRSGYGWDRATGEGSIGSMADSADTAGVDFYVTDLDTGHVRMPYVIASPHKVDSIDLGSEGTVPRGLRWRTNGLSDTLGYNPDRVPAYAPPPAATYFVYTSIPSAPQSLGCYTAGEQEKHYAKIRVLSLPDSTGAVQIESWYQLVPGLRLMGR